MREKEWHTYEMMVNGLPQKIRYNADTVEGLFLPLLRRLRELQRRSGRRCTACHGEIDTRAVLGAAFTH